MEHGNHSELGVGRARRASRGVHHRMWAAISAVFLIGGVIVVAAPEAGAQGTTYFVGDVTAGVGSSASDCSNNTN